MAKINATGLAYPRLAVALVGFVVLVLQMPSPVGAVDIIFFTSTSECSGAGYSFNGVGGQVCCAVSASDGGSVLVTSASSSTQSRFYRGGACTTQVGTGTGNFCLLGGQFTGAFWFNGRRRSLLGDLDSSTCTSQMKPTGVVFNEEGSKGRWILKSSDAADLYSQMTNVPDAEKADWLKSLGATYTEH